MMACSIDILKEDDFPFFLNALLLLLRFYKKRPETKFVDFSNANTMHCITYKTNFYFKTNNNDIKHIRSYLKNCSSSEIFDVDGHG